MKNIVWFRRDLRVEDNHALSQVKSGEVLPIFIFDSELLKTFPKDDLRVNFIYKRVLKLKEDLQTIGLDLAIFYGKPKEVFRELFKQNSFTNIFASGDNDFYSLQRDEEIKKEFPLTIVHDNFLLISQEILKKDGTPYRVFTPFYNSIKHLIEPLSNIHYKFSVELKLLEFDYKTLSLEDIGVEKIEFLLEELNMEPLEILDSFASNIEEYSENRDFLYKDATSKLGVHLRFGTISIREVIRYFFQKNAEDFIRQLIWREFFNYLFVHFPKSEFENFQDVSPIYDNNREIFEAWCQGKTGVPIVDAGMRELNKTGYIHNRARMVVASFLTKNLAIDWRWGERYFREKLIDYEASSNVGSWQWAASTGADAVPYFRVFNPYLQSKKFDKECRYIKQWVEELRDISSSLIHKEEFLLINAIKNFPKPLVAQKQSALKFKTNFKK